MRMDEAFLTAFNPAFRGAQQNYYDREAQQKQLDQRMAENDAAQKRFETEMQARDKAQQDAVADRAAQLAMHEKELQGRMSERFNNMADRKLDREESAKYRQENSDTNTKLRESQEYNLHFDNAVKTLPSMSPDELAGVARPLFAKAQSGAPLSVQERAYLDAGRFAYGVMKNTGQRPKAMEQTVKSIDPVTGAEVFNKQQVPIPGAPAPAPWNSFEDVMSGKPAFAPAPATPAPTTVTEDPVFGARTGLAADLLKQRTDEATKLLGEDTKEMAGGDNRYGFLNLGSRGERVKESEGVLRAGQKDAAALDWARKNPNDPRTPGILDDLTKRYAR